VRKTSCSSSVERQTPASIDVVELRHAHKRSVAIEIPLGDDYRVFRGRGEFASDRLLGGVLQIVCEDSHGSFELLIREQEWTGNIRPDNSYGCDFAIRLA